jgi:hypothetical protein
MAGKRFLRKVRVLGKKVLPVAGVATVVVAGKAMAGADTTFDDITTTINDWATGSLGKTLTLGTLLVGGGYAVASQSVKAAISAVGVALILAYGPSVLQGIFSAMF